MGYYASGLDAVLAFWVLIAPLCGLIFLSWFPGVHAGTNTLRIYATSMAGKLLSPFGELET